MAYLALYRKYRPSTFDEIVGQTAVKTALQNQVRFGKVGHAYLFCGTRGTGKTSTAKVFARAVNCLHPVNGNPCNACELCREAETGFNVVEIDAASNNSVDNIRDLREEVQYTPSMGKYKVYIIDEVHMLSTSAFNALLKTLEEPPEHVIFILATTDPQKVLPTIVSRCQRYDFKRITLKDLTERLKEVCRQEGIQAENEALEYIASVSDGAMRDALSILDQCHAYYIHEDLTLARVQDTLGAVDQEIFTVMTDALAQKDTEALLRGVRKIFDDGRDPLQFVLGWIRYLRDLLVVLTMGKRADDLLEGSIRQKESLIKLAPSVDKASVTVWIEALADLEAQLRLSSQRKILMEVALIRLSEEAPAVVAASSKEASQLSLEGQRVSRPAEVPAVPPAAEKPATQEPLRKQETQPASGTGKAGQTDVSWWPKLRDSLIGRSASLRVLSYIKVRSLGEDTLELSADNGIYLKQLEVNNKEKLRFLETEIEKHTGNHYRLILKAPNSMGKETPQGLQNKINMDIQWR